MRYPLELTLRPSRRLQTLLAAIHLIAAAAFFLSSFPAWARGAVPMLLLFSLASRLAHERAKSELALVLRTDGTVAVGRAGALRPARPVPGAADFGWAVWLRLVGPTGGPSLPKACRALMLMPDSLDGDGWRALRIWLRHKAAVSDSVAT